MKREHQDTASLKVKMMNYEKKMLRHSESSGESDEL